MPGWLVIVFSILFVLLPFVFARLLSLGFLAKPNTDNLPSTFDEIKFLLNIKK